MNESHTLFAHIALEDGSEGKETLSINLLHLYSHLHTLDNTYLFQVRMGRAMKM